MWSGVQVHVYMCAETQVDIGYLPCSLTTLFTDAGLLLNPEFRSPASHFAPGHLWSTLPVLRLEQPPLPVSCGIWTPVHPLAQHTLYPLSHGPKPIKNGLFIPRYRWRNRLTWRRRHLSHITWLMGGRQELKVSLDLSSWLPFLLPSAPLWLPC